MFDHYFYPLVHLGIRLSPPVWYEVYMVPCTLKLCLVYVLVSDSTFYSAPNIKYAVPPPSPSPLLGVRVATTLPCRPSVAPFSEPFYRGEPWLRAALPESMLLAADGSGLRNEERRLFGLLDKVIVVGEPCRSLLTTSYGVPEAATILLEPTFSVPSPRASASAAAVLSTGGPPDVLLGHDLGGEKTETSGLRVVSRRETAFPPAGASVALTTAPPRHRLRFVSVGTLSPRKDQLGLVNALSAACAAHPEGLGGSTLTLIGSAGADPAYAAAVRAAADAANADANGNANGGGFEVRLPGALPHDETLQSFLSSDAFLFNSRFESWAVAPVEAALRGVPVLSTRVGALRESLPSESTMWVGGPEGPKGGGGAGNGNINGNGHGNGHGNGIGNGKGNGKGHDNGHGNGNGIGKDIGNGNDKGNSNGHGHGHGHGNINNHGGGCRDGWIASVADWEQALFQFAQSRPRLAVDAARAVPELVRRFGQAAAGSRAAAVKVLLRTADDDGGGGGSGSSSVPLWPPRSGVGSTVAAHAAQCVDIGVRRGSSSSSAFGGDGDSMAPAYGCAQSIASPSGRRQDEGLAGGGAAIAATAAAGEQEQERVRRATVIHAVACVVAAGLSVCGVGGGAGGLAALVAVQVLFLVRLCPPLSPANIVTIFRGFIPSAVVWWRAGSDFSLVRDAASNK